MTDEEKLQMMEKELLFEQKFCARVAAIHQDSKDRIKAYKTSLKEVKEKIGRSKM